MAGKSKLAVDIPQDTKDKLAEIAYQDRTNMTQAIIQLVEVEADKRKIKLKK